MRKSCEHPRFRTDNLSLATNTSLMLEVEEAQARIIAAIRPLSAESIALADAAGRIPAQDIVASISLPPFDNSAMDGYAVRATDVTMASVTSPCRLKRIGDVPAGGSFSGTVEGGTCVRVFTGAPLPHGSDAVVMQEDTRTVADEFVEVLDAVKAWENVRLAGEDVKAGTVIARAGDRVNAARIGLLGAMGTDRLTVTRKPVVGILGTGNELIEAGDPLAPGQIYESNRAAIASLVAQSGGSARMFGLVRDTEEAIRKALQLALAECDAVVTSGGVSVGEHDCVKPAFESLGGTIEFWRVNAKPGKPFVCGRCGDKFLFGLPGNPVSAFVTFLLLVRPAILKMQGAAELELPEHPAVLAERFHNTGDRRHFMRIAVNSKGEVRSAGTQASHMLSSLVGANALLDVPPKTLWHAGQQVRVLRLEL